MSQPINILHPDFECKNMELCELWLQVLLSLLPSPSLLSPLIPPPPPPSSPSLLRLLCRLEFTGLNEYVDFVAFREELSCWEKIWLRGLCDLMEEGRRRGQPSLLFIQNTLWLSCSKWPQTEPQMHTTHKYMVRR